MNADDLAKRLKAMTNYAATLEQHGLAEATDFKPGTSPSDKVQRAFDLCDFIECILESAYPRTVRYKLSNEGRSVHVVLAKLLNDIHIVRFGLQELLDQPPEREAEGGQSGLCQDDA
jgi:hypothetical protein